MCHMHTHAAPNSGCEPDALANKRADEEESMAGRLSTRPSCVFERERIPARASRVCVCASQRIVLGAFALTRPASTGAAAAAARWAGPRDPPAGARGRGVVKIRLVMKR
jgi:hypothetical protein